MINCLGCNKEVIQSTTKPRLFCSDSCRKAHNRKAYNKKIDNGQDNGQIDNGQDNEQEIKDNGQIMKYPKSDKDWYDVKGQYHNHQEWTQSILPQLRASGASSNYILTIAGI